MKKIHCMACCRDQDLLPIIVTTHKTQLRQKVLCERIAFIGVSTRMKFNKKKTSYFKCEGHSAIEKYMPTHTDVNLM